MRRVSWVINVNTPPKVVKTVSSPSRPEQAFDQCAPIQLSTGSAHMAGHPVGGFMKSIKAKLLGIAAAAALILSVGQVGHAQRRSGEAAPAQGGKSRVVVLATGSSGTLWTTNVTTASLEDALTQSGRFELITGAQRDKLLSEQGFNNSDLVDPKQ